MARNQDDRLKRTLLLCFVALSVVLIIGTYATDLAGSSDPAPAFYRSAPTAAPSTQQTVTAPTREHRGRDGATPMPPGDDGETGDRYYDDV